MSISFNYNLGYEAIKLGLERESLYHVQIKRYIGEAEDIERTLDQLIDLNGKLRISDKDTKLSDEIIKFCQDLKAKKIDLLEGGERTLSPDRLRELKEQIHAHSERLRSELQKKFTTQISVAINELNSMLESLKTIEKYYDRLIDFILSKSANR